MRMQRGFTLLEMMVSTALFVTGAVYVYGTFSSVTASSRNATVDINLGSQNKRAMTRLFAELQASSMDTQDTDGLDSTDPEPVCVITDDAAAPKPWTKAKIVTRAAGWDQEADGTYKLGQGRQQARERVLTTSKMLRFRKVVGYQFKETSGTIGPEWSRWVTVRLNERRQLVRQVEGGATRVIANRVDAFDIQWRSDNTLLVTIVTARRDPSNGRVRRYANAVTIHPKN